MASKLAVIDDLSLVNGEDCLEFYDDYALHDVGFSSANTWGYETIISFCNTALTDLHVFCGAQNAFGARPRAYLALSDGFLTFGVGSKSAATNLTTFQIECDKTYHIIGDYDGSVFSLIVDDVLISSITESVDSLLCSVTIGGYAIGYGTVSYRAECTVSKFNYSENGKTYEYIQNGDYGSTTLIDHSGNDNDGSIIGPTWNKSVNGQPVDIVAPDQQTLLAQLPVTPVETWEVIDTTIGSTVPPTNDPSWLLYDEDWLTVYVQKKPISVTDKSYKYSYSFSY